MKMLSWPAFTAFERLNYKSFSDSQIKYIEILSLLKIGFQIEICRKICIAHLNVLKAIFMFVLIKHR